MKKMTFKEKSELEDIMTDLYITEDLFKILSEYFKRLEGKEFEGENNEKIFQEWYILKHNFEEQKSLSYTILNSLEKAKNNLSDFISEIKTSQE